MFSEMSQPHPVVIDIKVCIEKEGSYGIIYEPVCAKIQGNVLQQW